MPVERWRALKGILYALIISVVAIVGIVESSWVQPVIAMVCILLVFGVEIKEIEIANYVSVFFHTPDDYEDDDE